MPPARWRRSSGRWPRASGTTHGPIRARSRATRSGRRCAAAHEQCVAWAAEAGVEDGYFHEELAEDYAALGRHADSREQARRALELATEDDDPARVARLQILAGD
jgi:hypothetical protein